MTIVRPPMKIVRPPNNIVRPLKLIYILIKLFAHRKLGHTKLAKFGLLTQNRSKNMCFEVETAYRVFSLLSKEKTFSENLRNSRSNFLFSQFFFENGQ